MHHKWVIGLLVVLAISAMLTGTILAQGDGPTPQNQRAWLGVQVSESEAGVVVSRVDAGSPAEDAGLLVGDVIVSVDGDAIASASALVDAVQAHAPGDVIALAVTRTGSDQTLTVTLGTVQGRGRGGEDDLFADASVDAIVKAERALHVDLDAVEGGYAVLAGRMRAESDLQSGDVITAVNGTPVQDVDWAALLTEQAASDSPALTLTVQRGGAEMTVEIAQIGGRPGHGPLGQHGRPGQDSANPSGQSGQPTNPGGTDSQGGTVTAPHPVDPGVACSSCHGNTQPTSPSLPGSST